MLNTMYEQEKSATSKNDTVTPKSAMKGECQPNDGKTLQFMDLCDNVIDIIMCELHLDDLANISDTSRRLRGIASSVFSRRHPERLISMNAFHYPYELCDELRAALPLYSEHGAIVILSDIKVWLKFLRNFGASIKYLRIQNYDYRKSISIALQNAIEYVSKFCGDSLEILEVVGFSSFTLTKSFANLQEFRFCAERFENSDALELMPNLRTLVFRNFPQIMAKLYPKLERVDSELDTDEEVETFISFLNLNPQIKYLKLGISFNCKPEHIESIYSSIADNLTQLTTLKLNGWNKPKVFAHYRFLTVDSFSISYGEPQHNFEFNDLKKLTLRKFNTDLSYSINFAQRNKNLKILKLDYPLETLVDDGAIRNLLSELPELEQLTVRTDNNNRCSIFKNLLGKEWEQYEKEKPERFKPNSARDLQHFRKIDRK